MSHSDRHVRRPTKDDRRRSPDFRDSHRNSYSKGESDPYRDDRYRRDRDTDLRDRRQPSKPSRDPPPANSARPSQSASVARSEHGTKPSSASASRSPTDSPGADRSNAYDKLIQLSKPYTDAITELAKLKAERDPLDRVLKQRQADYEKSMVRHAEFPSIPEVQNMHRTKYAERVRALDAQIKKAEEDVEKAFQPIAHILCGAALTQTKFSTQIRESEKTTVHAGTLQLQDTAKKQQAEIDDLKTQLRQIQTRHSQEQADLKADFTKRCKQMKDEMEEEMREMMREFKKEMKEAKIKAGKDEAKRIGAKEEVNEMKEQFRDMEEDVKELKKRQAESEQSQRQDLQSRLSEQEQVLKRVMAEQLSEHRASSGHVSSAEVSSLISQERSDRQSDISGLLQRVEELAGQLYQHGQDTISLRANMAAYNQQVEDQARKVDEHEAKLSSVDLDALEGIAETISFDFPKLQRKVDAMESTMETTRTLSSLPASLAKEVDTKYDTLFAQVQQVVSNMTTTAGQLVDGALNEARVLRERVTALEESSSSSNHPSVTQERTTRPEFEAISSDVDFVKSELDSIRGALDSLTQETCTGLSEEINQINHNVQSASRDFADQLEFVRHSFTVLDTKFNNLSTKALAEHIIGQLEQVYPNARQLVADIEGLKMLADGLTTRIESLEGQMHEHKAKADDESKFAGIDEQIAKHMDEFQSRNGLPQKRRRTDSGPNGAEHPVVNGLNGTNY